MIEGGIHSPDTVSQLCAFRFVITGRRGMGVLKFNVTPGLFGAPGGYIGRFSAVRTPGVIRQALCPALSFHVGKVKACGGDCAAPGRSVLGEVMVESNEC